MIVSDHLPLQSGIVKTPVMSRGFSLVICAVQITA
jgi:hypothetical protein